MRWDEKKKDKKKKEYIRREENQKNYLGSTVSVTINSYIRIEVKSDINLGRNNSVREMHILLNTWLVSFISFAI